MRLRWRRWALAALMLPLALLSASCSFTNLAYDHLDWVVRYYLSDFVDMTSEQRAAFDPRFAALWRWHRATQMPLYAAEAHAIAREIQRGPQTADQIQATLKSINDFVEPTVRRVVRDGAPLLGLLSDAQVQDLLAALDRRIDKEHRRAEKLDDREWHEREFDESRSSFERYLGSLSDAQESRIRSYTDAAVRDHDLFHRAALASRARFADLLGHRREPDFAAQVQAMLDADTPESKVIEARQTASRARFVELLADLGATYTPKQRSHFHDRVESLAEDLDTLAKEAVDASGGEPGRSEAPPAGTVPDKSGE